MFILCSYRKIPLSIVDKDIFGIRRIDNSVLLREREAFVPVDTSRPFKLNGGTTGVCASLSQSLSDFL
jgi:aminopeptidase 2